MKQGKWTRITAVLFAAAMLLSLSACGDTLPEVSNPTTTIPSTPTEQTAYWITFSHPLDYIEAVTITGGSTLHENHVQELQDMVGRLTWYGADIMADTSFGGEACFSLDGQKRYYINLISGEMFDGVQIADLSQEDINLLDYLVRADNPTHHATHTLTGTMQEWNKAEQYLVLAVTKADQTDLIGKNVKVSTRYDVGGVPVVGTSVDVGYDGTVIDGMVYGLTIDGLDSDQLGGPDTETTTTTTETTTATTTTTTTFIPQPIGELSSDMVKRIKDDWMAVHPVSDRPAEYIKLTYYGTYGDCVVLSIFDYGLLYPDGGPDREDIAGFSFFYPQAYDLWVWNNGEFYHLREVYAKGWVSKVDVQNVAYYFNSR